MVSMRNKKKYQILPRMWNSENTEKPVGQASYKTDFALNI